MHPDILERQIKLQALFDEVKRLNESRVVDETLVAQFVWYLCKRTCGYLEESLRTILLEFFESENDHPPISDFVSRQLNLSHGFQFRRVRSLVKSFSEKQRNGSNEIDYTKLVTSMASLQKNRNMIAYGNDSEISFERLAGYFEDAKEVVRLIYLECGPIKVDHQMPESD